MKILGEDISLEEKDVLSAIPYNENDVYLHAGKEEVLVGRGVFLPEILKRCGFVFGEAQNIDTGAKKR
jgi:hypothetical protein